VEGNDRIDANDRVGARRAPVQAASLLILSQPYRNKEPQQGFVARLRSFIAIQVLATRRPPRKVMGYAGVPVSLM
jgi:hypothetical protein